MRLEFKQNVSANITAYCFIIHGRVIKTAQCPTYYARLRKLSLLKKYSLFNTRDKNQDSLRSRKIIHHDYTNVCESARIYRWKEICREGSGGVENHSLSLHFYVSHAGIS